MAIHKVITVFFACLICIFQYLPAQSHDDDSLNYISWGADEYELFGLSKTELEQRFKDRLKFDWVNGFAYFDDCAGRFLITFNNKKVSTVQRTLRDPAGCNLMGPYLADKEDAVRFAVEGLSHYGKLNAADTKRLADAKQALAAMHAQPAGQKH